MLTVSGDRDSACEIAYYAMAVSLPRQSYDLMNREANGRTAYEYDAIASVKSDTLKRSLTKDEPSIEGQGMNFKDKNESDNEPDGEPAAKMRRGGGRRKQSKPMRMFAELDSLPDSDPSQPVSSQLSGELEALDNGKSAECLTETLPSSTFVCELCHENFLTEVAVKEHVDQIHAMVLDEEQSKNTICPTKYHLLGKELKQESKQEPDFEAGSKDEVKEMRSATENAVAPNSSSLREEGSVESSNWTPIKREDENSIFEAESLKVSDRSHHTLMKEQFQGRLFSTGGDSQPTHGVSLGPRMEKPLESSGVKQTAEFRASTPAFEAGIQSETHSQAAAAAAAAAGGWDPAKSRIFHPDAYCEICDREFCNKYFLKTHKANKHGIYDNNVPGMETSTSVNNDIFFNMLSQQPPGTSSSSSPKTSPPKASVDFGSCSAGMSVLPAAPGPGVSSSSEDLESLASVKLASDSDECCEICQKHFLSKNQLKRHKQEVHGFSQGPDAGKRSNTAGLSVTSPSSIPLSVSMETSSASHPLLLPHMATTSSSLPPALPDFGRMANLSNLMFLNPFTPPLAVIPPLFPTPGLGFRPNALTIPQLPLPDVQKTGSTSRFPSDASTLPSSLLQSMGVLNAEALMELYRKEFCSNYMMRSQEANPRTGLFPTSMTSFQTGMPTSLAGGMTFPLPGKTGNQDSAINSESLLLKKEKYEMSADSCEICEICNKTFVNKQSLVSHLLSTHNTKQESCDLASELMKLDKLNDEHHFEKAMFGNMVAAKLVDRVQCDICNKEVCNKYFLKTHKIKVHGWDPVSGERDMQEKVAAKQASPLLTQNVVPEPPVADILNVEKPKEEELLQMGIDPEAYCEICKKEFCNKYFLKTHKQNIHGIKTTTNPLDNRTIQVENWNFPQTPSQPNSLTATQLSLLAGPQQLQSMTPALNPPPSLMSVLDSGVVHDSAAEKRSWKWKEPVNAMRVTCEICNKVLCNKYFLKTHMMKRHGVNYDTITGQLMTPVKNQGLPEYMTTRDDSHGPDDLQSTQHMTPQQLPSNIQTVVKHTGIPERKPTLGEVVTDNEDDGSFTSFRTIDRHDEERAGGCEAESRVSAAVNLALSETSKALDLTSAGTTVMAKTWHVPADDHDFDEHTTDNESRFGSGSCTLTGAEVSSLKGADGGTVPFAEKESLKLHGLKETITDEAHGSSDASSPLSSSFEESRSQGSIQSMSSFGKMEIVQTAETAKAAVANHIRSQQKKRMFRCTHCRERFHLRSQCEDHIRNAHPRLEGPGLTGLHGDSGSERTGRKQSNASNESISSTNSVGYLNGYANTKPPNFSSESTDRKDSVVGLDVIASKQPVTYAQPIDQANLSNILMQPFLLKEVGGENHFAASLVYLPALQKINEPVSVTFSLTPILQH